MSPHSDSAAPCQVSHQPVTRHAEQCRYLLAHSLASETPSLDRVMLASVVSPCPQSENSLATSSTARIRPAPSRLFVAQTPISLSPSIPVPWISAATI